MAHNEQGPDTLRDRMSQGIAAAALRAMEDARRDNVPLIVWRDGKIVAIPPDELPKAP